MIVRWCGVCRPLRRRVHIILVGCPIGHYFVSPALISVPSVNGLLGLAGARVADS
jgi:hypothetical protein